MTSNYAALKWLVNGTQVYDENHQLLCVVPSSREDAYRVARRLGAVPELIEAAEAVVEEGSDDLIAISEAYERLVLALEKAEGGGA